VAHSRWGITRKTGPKSRGYSPLLVFDRAADGQKPGGFAGEKVGEKVHAIGGRLSRFMPRVLYFRDHVDIYRPDPRPTPRHPGAPGGTRAGNSSPPSLRARARQVDRAALGEPGELAGPPPQIGYSGCGRFARKKLVISRFHTCCECQNRQKQGRRSLSGPDGTEQQKDGRLPDRPFATGTQGWGRRAAPTWPPPGSRKSPQKKKKKKKKKTTNGTQKMWPISKKWPINCREALRGNRTVDLLLNPIGDGSRT